MNLTPADVAELNQAHTAATADLDHAIAEQRQQLATHDPVIAAAMLHAELLDHCHPDVLAGFAALAITRLATQEP